MKKAITSSPTTKATTVATAVSAGPNTSGVHVPAASSAFVQGSLNAL